MLLLLKPRTTFKSMREKDFTATAPPLRVQGCLRLDLLRLGLLRVWTTREGQSNPKPSYATINQWVRIVWFIQRCIQILSSIQIQTVEITSGSFLHSCRFVFGGVKTAFVSAQKATIKNWEFYGLFLFQSLLWSVLLVLTIISSLALGGSTLIVASSRATSGLKGGAERLPRPKENLEIIANLISGQNSDLCFDWLLQYLSPDLPIVPLELLTAAFTVFENDKKSHENILWIWINAEST